MSAIDRFLKASEYFLTQKDYEGCLKYALKIQEIDPPNPSAIQLLTIAETLIANENPIANSQPNYYSILQLNLYTNDQHLIQQNFIKLVTILNPNTNKYPFATQAQLVVREAWLLLSNSVKKIAYDDEVRGVLGDVGGGFWTICPYCYWVYEYERAYLECCLRCQNERCLRGFHGVEIDKPPVGDVESGGYKCTGFFPLGYDWGEDKGADTWSPFLPTFTNEKNESFAEIIDDDSDRPNVENGKPSRKRIKTVVPKTAKKLNGRGTRLERRGVVSQSSNDDGSEDESVGEMENGGNVVEGVDFYETDDVFEGLPDDF